MKLKFARNLKCLVVDDESLARVLLKEYISHFSFLELIGECKNPFQAIEIINRQHIDLIFLDIQMPEISGLDFLRSNSHKTHVIITTAYPEHALEGYNLNVIDYLVKPFGLERFMQAITKFQNYFQLSTTDSTGTITTAGKDQRLEYIKVYSDHKTYRLNTKDIQYIQGMREYVAFHMSNQKRILSLMSLKKLEDQLPNQSFVRIHKSYIISIQKATILEGKNLYINDTKIPIGPSYYDAVVNVFMGESK
ncbi:LytR/AlgR family response regulator transcription factor [Maribacter sp. IgM3_T14_3]|uniref:LytR/AlgR family response regulator transcription factor n=1 Tax=Maribacter sp. IgM3_T14_3 TaxID=3415140 RepID=UPI003C6EAB1C